MKKYAKTKVVCILALVFFIAAVVVKYAHTTPSTSLEQRTITIQSDTQGTYGDLKIGLGPLREGDYVLQDGKHVAGRVAELWLSYRDDASLNKKVLAKQGERVTIGRYAFTVQYIHGGRGSVELVFDTDP